MSVVDYQRAVALKEAGLRWNAKPGDNYYLPGGETRQVLQKGEEPAGHAVYAPKILDMQQEIKENGYGYQLFNHSHGRGGWVVEIFSLYTMNFGVNKHGFFGASPEEAVAEALLWVLATKDNASET
ncbi:hypothetical protein [Desulfofalx alkaliphila]|uniref:hypothetical protein n=1 Tax=Desulfofalx alkaliphila TaxID=105483 RepID=UPI0004E12FD3|nr:hypothetical protein [Desulfofalx alkaliphila]